MSAETRFVQEIWRKRIALEVNGMIVDARNGKMSIDSNRPELFGPMFQSPDTKYFILCPESCAMRAAHGTKFYLATDPAYWKLSGFMMQVPMVLPIEHPQAKVSIRQMIKAFDAATRAVIHHKEFHKANFDSDKLLSAIQRQQFRECETCHHTPNISGRCVCFCHRILGGMLT